MSDGNKSVSPEETKRKKTKARRKKSSSKKVIAKGEKKKSGRKAAKSTVKRAGHTSKTTPGRSLEARALAQAESAIRALESDAISNVGDDESAGGPAAAGSDGDVPTARLTKARKSDITGQRGRSPTAGETDMSETSRQVPASSSRDSADETYVTHPVMGQDDNARKKATGFKWPFGKTITVLIGILIVYSIVALFSNDEDELEPKEVVTDERDATFKSVTKAATVDAQQPPKITAAPAPPAEPEISDSERASGIEAEDAGSTVAETDDSQTMAPVAQSPVVAAKNEKINTTSDITSGYESLKAQLEPWGWRVQRDWDGSILLFPGTTETGIFSQRMLSPAHGSWTLYTVPGTCLMPGTCGYFMKTADGDLIFVAALVR